MAMLNIPTSCSDPSYRYKMPRLVTRIQGHGKMIKTCVVNMDDVARALKRSPAHTTKWFGYELGAQSTYTNKGGDGERSIISGAHETPIFQGLLDKFIEKYVLCSNCNLPEIDMMVKKGLIVARCKACGWKGELDNGHKLATFVIKNPDLDKGGFGEEGGKTAKPDRKARQAARAEKARKSKDGFDEDDEDEDVEADSKVDSPAKKEKKKTKDDDDYEEGDAEAKKDKEKKHKKDKKERSEKKEKKEKKEKTEKKEKKEKRSGMPADQGSDSASEGNAVKGGGDSDDDCEELKWDDEETQNVIGCMQEFLEREGGKLSVDAFFEEIRAMQVAKLFDNRMRFFIALEALFGDAMTCKKVTAKKAYLEDLIAKGRLSTPEVLWSLDTYLHRHEGSAKGFAQVLKVFYDEDFVVEEELLHFYEEGSEDEASPGFVLAKKHAAPFLQWLQEAEAESESDE